MEKGLVVIATAGKEKGNLYVVVDYLDGYVFLADGKRLKREKPKKKSVKHIKKASAQKFSSIILEDKNLRVNAAIREFLKNLKKGE